ncbi:LysR family transcriptional regulator [Chromobacterium violaceum]|uniref:Probable transcriptional regulator n=1 Tax=Chromobacterium violaceum (strain ATCC 12472 / DSM 30191 / JCM 1249 / CCUG 213 / NBRC 12614 / NCIMB 9131 / NCTC 9757 / MK) TaxID=243365 RepID=Q7NRW3_CHRVO|nr:LysR family transcriptional regulator [Chromobacterium violaceum]AAQ61327.2 probable transcriptional regulator [Chromobacterium violaceum ATCC 12472]SUX88340.1 HTH-type transcriptional activator CmpR [Chromobacterium violaceum]
MSISLEDLELLLDVAELGSFSQAAARRGWSQPQASQRVALLEKRLGAPLFSRHRRGAEPTAACQAFLPAARAALDALAEGRNRLAGAEGLPRLRMACLPSLAGVIFGPLLHRLAEAPMEIRCDTDHSPQILQLLLAGELDIGFVLHRPAIPGLEQDVLCDSPIVAVAEAAHPLAAAERPLSLGRLAGYPLAPQNWGEGAEELVRRLRGQCASARPIHLLQPAAAARDLALWHGYVAFVPRLAVRQELEKGVLRELALAEPELGRWRVMMAWRGGKRRDAAKTMALDAARALARDWR